MYRDQMKSTNFEADTFTYLRLKSSLACDGLASSKSWPVYPWLEVCRSRMLQVCPGFQRRSSHESSVSQQRLASSTNRSRRWWLILLYQPHSSPTLRILMQPCSSRNPPPRLPWRWQPPPNALENQIDPMRAPTTWH